MSISQKRYVEITSAVVGEPTVGSRELIARVMTTNPLAPMGSVIEFTSLDNVGGHFGTESAEYKFAQLYFGFVSKDVSSPRKIGFARWANVDTAPQLISTISAPSVAAFKAVTNGSFVLNMGGISYTVTGLNFASANDLASVAGIIQTGISANSAGGTLFTGATVVFENGKFILTGGDEGEATITATEAPASGVDVGAMIGWNAAGLPVVSQGSALETPVSAMSRIDDLSNNFGSFVFLSDLTVEQIADVAAWVNAGNVRYLYSIGCTPADVVEIVNAVKGMNGVSVTLQETNYDGSVAAHDEVIPCAILAATDYTRANSTQNFMYQQMPGINATVSTNASADFYDKMLVNYYGSTQSAGQPISFYQRGVLMGEVSDMGVYCNEMWFKDAMWTALMNQLLGQTKIPANARGKAMVKAAQLDVIGTAILNGTILPGKDLTQLQKSTIYSMTNQADAWLDVQNNGYWLDIVISQVTNANSGAVEYIAKYLLIYAKGDSIKKIEGTHALI